MQRKRIVCVDIGSHTLKAIAGSMNGSKIHVEASVRIASKGVALGMVYDVDRCTEALRELLEKVEAKQDDFIIVGISAYELSIEQSMQTCVFAEHQEIDKECIKDLFAKAEEAYLPVEKELLNVINKFYNVDNARGLINPLGMSGVKIEAVYSVISCRKTILATIEKCFANAGYVVGRTVFAPYYTAQATFTEAEKESKTLLIDIGADNTWVSFYIGGSLRMCFAMPFGSHSLTLDIRGSYPVSLEQAERFKKQFAKALEEQVKENVEVGFYTPGGEGKSLRVNELSGVVQCRLDEIFRGIRYHLKEVKVLDTIETIVFVGGGSALEGMRNYLGQGFNVEARKGVVVDGLLDENSSLDTKDSSFLSLLGILKEESLREEEQVVEKDTGGSFRWKGIYDKFKDIFTPKSREEDKEM